MGEIRASRPSFGPAEGGWLMLQAVDSTPRLPPLSCSLKSQPCPGAAVITVQVACYHPSCASYRRVCFVRLGPGAGGPVPVQVSRGRRGDGPQEEASPQGAFLPRGMLPSLHPYRAIRSSLQLWGPSLIQDLHSSPGPSSPSLLFTGAQTRLFAGHLHF